jgi:iron complex outermembrane receptor protein
VSLLYRTLEDTAVRVSGGHAYRAPSVLELFQPDVNFGSLVFRANPDLQPEHITSADAGIEQRTGALRAHVDVFYNEMDDLIGRRTTGNTITFENVDEAWSAGAEAGLDCSLNGWLPGLTVFVNGTRQRTEDRHTGLNLAYMPETIANTGILMERTIRTITWSGSIRENYVGTRGYLDSESGRWQSLDDYWRTDVFLKAAHRSGIWVALAAQNVMNTTYREASTVDPAPGRLWYVETGVQF